MTDDVQPAQPPFDDVPTPEESGDGGQSPPASRFGSRPTVWLALIVLVALGVGQSVGFMLLFGEKLGGLSDQTDEKSDSTDHVAVVPEQGRTPTGPRTKIDPTRDTLDVGRDALRSGDIQTGRVVAASFLLSLDGRSEADRDRESEALALLGQVLATEYSAHDKAKDR